MQLLFETFRLKNKSNELQEKTEVYRYSNHEKGNYSNEFSRRDHHILDDILTLRNGR